MHNIYIYILSMSKYMYTYIYIYVKIYIYYIHIHSFDSFLSVTQPASSGQGKNLKSSELIFFSMEVAVFLSVKLHLAAF